MILKIGYKLKGMSYKVILTLLLIFFVSSVSANDKTVNNTNLSDKVYIEYVEGLKKSGLYQNKDGTIGGVFNMLDGSTLRITGLDKDGGLIGFVPTSDGMYQMKRFSFEEMERFIERRAK